MTTVNYRRLLLGSIPTKKHCLPDLGVEGALANEYKLLKDHFSRDGHFGLEVQPENENIKYLFDKFGNVFLKFISLKFNLKKLLFFFLHNLVNIGNFFPRFITIMIESCRSSNGPVFH